MIFGYLAYDIRIVYLEGNGFEIGKLFYRPKNDLIVPSTVYDLLRGEETVPFPLPYDPLRNMIVGPSRNTIALGSCVASCRNSPDTYQHQCQYLLAPLIPLSRCPNHVAFHY